MKSDPSNEIDFWIPRPKPGSPGLLDIPIAIESSHDLKSWQAVASVDITRETPAAFYRMRVRQAAPVVASGLKAAATLSPVKSPFTTRTMKRTRTTPPMP